MNIVVLSLLEGDRGNPSMSIYKHNFLGYLVYRCLCGEICDETTVGGIGIHGVRTFTS